MLRSTVRAGLLAGAATLFASAPALAAGPEDDQTGDVVVTGAKPVAVGTSGTKTDTPILETPQSISVVDASEIANLGLQNLNQALRLVAGVTPETRGSAAEVYDQFKLRGFDAPIYLDGLKLFPSATGYAVPQVDVSRLDRIEVLKGPASALYGQSSPGGLIDETSKLPLDRSLYGAVSGTYGTYDLYRVDADIGGRIGEGQLWRVYGSANGASQQQQFGKRERQTLSAALTTGAGSRTSLTLLAAYSHDPFNGNYGVWPTLGTLIANPAGRISTKFYGGEPGDYFKREQLGLTYILNHDFGGGWAFRASGRYQYVRSRLGIVYTGGSPVDATQVAPTLFSRFSYATREHLNGWTYDNRLTGKVRTGPIEHNLLFGYDRQVSHSDELYAFGGGTPINVYNPVYGTMATPQSPYVVPSYDLVGFSPATFVDTRQRQQGAYAQDQMELGGLRVTLSGRQDWAQGAVNSQVQRNDKFTWRAGALYVTPFGLAPYVSYSTSFEPQAVVLANGDFAKPSLGKQIEAGAKYQLPGSTFVLTGAWFRIDQSDIINYDPVTFAAINQIGKVRSEGVEVEASGSLPYGFNVHAAFSRQRVKDGNGVGLPTVGRGGISANLEWAPKTGAAQGFAIGGTVRHVNSTYASLYAYAAPNFPASREYNTPAYTVFDALLRYDLGRASQRLEGVTLGVNATDLFDKQYLTSCFANYGWCWYGNRRTVQGTVGIRW